MCYLLSVLKYLRVITTCKGFALLLSVLKYLRVITTCKGFALLQFQFFGLFIILAHYFTYLLYVIIPSLD